MGYYVRGLSCCVGCEVPHRAAWIITTWGCYREWPRLLHRGDTIMVVWSCCCNEQQLLFTELPHYRHLQLFVATHLGLNPETSNIPECFGLVRYPYYCGTPTGRVRTNACKIHLRSHGSPSTRLRTYGASCGLPGVDHQSHQTTQVGIPLVG